MELLHNHTGPESAYVVSDYPYGFTLRCQIRYWLDYSPRHGFRLMSQTSNPKKPGLVWNKPKGSTYCRFGGAMFLDDNGHVKWSGLHEYMDCAETETWCATFRDAVPAIGLPLLDKWLAAKRAYEARKQAADKPDPLDDFNYVGSRHHY